MAYFSNGTEGDMYEAEYCGKCHWQPEEEPYECQIMFLHALFNYDQCGKDDRAKDLKTCLDALIPTDENGFADKCNFFLEKARHEQDSLFK